MWADIICTIIDNSNHNFENQLMAFIQDVYLKNKIEKKTQPEIWVIAKFTLCIDLNTITHQNNNDIFVPPIIP